MHCLQSVGGLHTPSETHFVFSGHCVSHGSALPATQQLSYEASMFHDFIFLNCHLPFLFLFYFLNFFLFALSYEDSKCVLSQGFSVEITCKC